MQQDSSNRFRSRWQLTFTKHIWPSLDRRWAANTVSPHRAPKPQRPDPDLGGPLFQRFRLGNVEQKTRHFHSKSNGKYREVWVQYEYMISFKKNKYCMLKKRKWCEKSSVGCIVLLVTFLTLVILDLPLFGKRWCSSDRISSPNRGWTKKTTSLILPRES